MDVRAVEFLKTPTSIDGLRNFCKKFNSMRCTTLLYILLLFFQSGWLHAEEELRVQIEWHKDVMSIGFSTVKDRYYVLEKSEDLRTWQFSDYWLPIEDGGKGSFYHYRNSEVRQQYFRVKAKPTSHALDDWDLLDAAARNDIDGDELNDAQELLNPEFLDIAADNRFSENDGSRKLLNMEQFVSYDGRENPPGFRGETGMRFVVIGINTPHPILYFINSSKHGHNGFVRNVLGYDLDGGEFNQKAYSGDATREIAAGYVVYHENFKHDDGRRGVFTFSFWPGDFLRYEYIQKIWDLFQVHMQLEEAQDNIFYFPMSQIQLDPIGKEEKYLYDSSDIKIISASRLIQRGWEPYYLGEAVGPLVIGNKDQSVYDSRSIVLFESVPNELSLLSGMVAVHPQTPFSHVTVHARQNKTPFCYVEEALKSPFLDDYVGKIVRLIVREDKCDIELATQEEFEAYRASLLPGEVSIPDADLEMTEIRPLDEITLEDVRYFGAKAAGVGELRRIKDDLHSHIPSGYAIPFHYYDRFMAHHGFYEVIQGYLDDEKFMNDVEYRDARLKEFRKSLKNAEIPSDLIPALDSMWEAFPALPLRFRSSTNNEDLVGFNGAGLYDSKTHHIGELNSHGDREEDEGHISKTVKQIWAGLWTFRAFETRNFYGIDHLKIYMGILVHPSFDGEVVNGVGVSKEINGSAGSGKSSLNVLPGEDLVTNPGEESRPDIYVVESASSGRTADPDQKYSIRQVSLHDESKGFLLERHYSFAIHEDLKVIEKHFKGRMDASYGFAVDVEFKLMPDGLYIKQARPWVD